MLFLITEDWFFYGARLTLARAARDLGFDVVVATRVRDHGERIRAEGFKLRPLSWRRRGDGIVATFRVIVEIARLYRTERPDIVHHAALKAIIFGAIAMRLAFRDVEPPVWIAAVMGLGAVFGRIAAHRYVRLHPLAAVLRLAIGRSTVMVENPEDKATLANLGVDPARMTLIRGTGVDPSWFMPLPEPRTTSITVALVGRMLRSKGIYEAAAAVRALRARGLDVSLLLAGGTDPDNPDTLTDVELRALNAEPGIEWLGRVADVRTVWAQAQIAVLPSTYGEGVPTALLEAAACGRPIVAFDVPGCREVARHGQTGLLVPPGDVASLAEALAALAGDAARRAAMARAGRELVTCEFADTIVAAQTLALYRAAMAEKNKRR